MNDNQELRTASSLRFVFTQKQKEIKVVDVKKLRGGDPNGSDQQSNDPKVKRAPGRRQADPGSKKKVEKAQEDLKKIKNEWGKAYRFVSEGKEPTFPVFLEISTTKECSADPFYLKMFREMAYGSFPKGIFYDINRETMVCTEPPSKKNTAVRRQRMEKYIRVCLPQRPVIDLESKTTLVSKDFENTKDLERTTELGEEKTEEIIDTKEVEEAKSAKEFASNSAEEELRNRQALRYIQRSYQRLELPVLLLKDKFGLSLDRIFQEIKLFIYMMIDILSPKDSVLLQEDSYQMILSGEIITALKTQKVWKKLSHLEQVSLICQYCRMVYVKKEGKPIDTLSPAQTKILRDIEDYVIGLFLTGCLTPQVIDYDGNKITNIRGIEIHSFGVRLERSILFSESKLPQEPETVAPVIFQKYRVVGLQKISNGIAKQLTKFSKLIDVRQGEES